MLPPFLDTMQSGVVERELRGGHKHREVGCPCRSSGRKDSPWAATAAQHEKEKTEEDGRIFERFTAYTSCCSCRLCMATVEALHYDHEIDMPYKLRNIPQSTACQQMPCL